MGKQIQSYVRKRLDFESLSSSRKVLRLLDDEETLSQPQAAKLLSMTTGACNLHFQRLEHEGLIHRVDKRGTGRGRPTLIWSIDRSRNACITLVFDVPFFHATLSDFSGEVIKEQREDLTGLSDQKELIKRVASFVRRAERTLSKREGTIRQIYAALPGLLEPHTGEVISAVNFPVLNGLNLKQVLNRFSENPCHVGSLGPAYYYGEMEDQAQDRLTMLIHWDLGIGFVFGQGRRILSLHSNSDGGSPLISELGHVRIERDGHRCHCGKSGCLEAYVGGWAILKALANRKIRALPELVEAVEGGDQQARAQIRKAARLLGRHLGWPIQLMNVDQILISGPLAPALQSAVGDFQKGLGALFLPDEIKGLTVRVSESPEIRVRRGAYLLAKRLFLYPDEFQGAAESGA